MEFTINNQSLAQQPANNSENTVVTDKMESANAEYIRQNKQDIRRRGLLDAGQTGGSPDALQMGLSLVRSQYITFCREHATVFREHKAKEINRLTDLQKKRVSELETLCQERGILADQLNSNRAYLARLSQRHYRLVELFKLLFAVIAVCLAASWVCFVYGNFFNDLTCSPSVLKNSGMFSIEGFRQGMIFCAVPLVLAIFIGLAPRSYWPMKTLFSLAFIAMDVIFSYNVEMRVIAVEAACGIDAPFDVYHFLMVTFWAFLPAVSLTASIAWAKSMFYLDGISEAKADQGQSQRKVDYLAEQCRLMDIRLQQKRDEVDSITHALSPKEEDNSKSIYWYSGEVVRQLCLAYFWGFMSFASSLDNSEESNTNGQNLKDRLVSVYNKFLEAA